MLNLSVIEQKQVIGGRVELYVYDPSGGLYETKEFATYKEANRYYKNKYHGWGSYDIYEFDD